jgi:hypothetical protein
MGMASYNKSEFVEHQEEIVEVSQDEESRNNYQKSMNILKRDLWIGIAGNALMIIMIAYMAYASFPKNMAAPSGIGIITSLGDAISHDSIAIATVFYIFIGLFLVDTWVAAADTLSKLHANMTLGLFNKESNELTSKETKAKLFYVVFLVLMLIMTFVSNFVAQPQQLNYLNGILSMFGSVLLIIGLFIVEGYYRKKLVEYPKHKFMYAMLILAFIVYFALCVAFMII